ncbi:MAG: hypothetical protein ACREIF_16210 [Chthoniobacterales bacterium]
MSLDQIAVVSQIVAAVGVVGSLIFVGLQVRQSNQMMRDGAIRHHAERIQSVSKAMFEDADLAGIWLKGGENVEKLSPEERVRFVNFYVYVLRVWEQLHLQKVAGIMDRQMWDANVNILRDIHRLPGAAAVWSVRRHLFSRRFQDFYESFVAFGEGKPLYDEANTRSDPSGKMKR